MFQLNNCGFFFVFLIFYSITLVAQNPPSTCDGRRYLQPVFNQVDTTVNVFFGVNTTHSGDVDSLYLDVYQPVGDIAAKRPLMILAFGGSFVVGQREDMAPLCHFYAQHGYVTATIDYRLFTGPFFPFPDSVVFADVVIKAVGDMKAAVRFFRADAAFANQYKIDSQLVIVGGGSAGAIMALHTAYLDSLDQLPLYLRTAIDNNGGFEGNTPTALAHGSAVQGVVNYSGALGSAAWIDAGDAPIFSVHDDGDNIVPYGQGYGMLANQSVSYLEGSQAITDTATALGIANSLITIPNSNGHVSYIRDSSWIDSIFPSSLRFLEAVVCPTVVGVAPIEDKISTAILLYPNPASGQFNIQINESITDAQYAVYNAIGQCLKTGVIDQPTTAIACQEWPVGYYRVVVKRRGKKMIWKTLVLSK
jgi:acetyl esterase/lipase